MQHPNILVMPEDHMERLYESRNPLVRFAHRQRLRAILARIPTDEKPLTILDAGCGEGHLLRFLHERFPGHRYYGVDITPVALERARVRCPAAVFERGDLARIPFSDATFDVIVSSEVLEHMHEYRTALKEFERLLRAEGKLIVTFPNETLWTIGRFFLGRRPVKVPDHVNAFTPSAICRATSLKKTYEHHLPFGLPFALSLTCLIEFEKSLRNSLLL